MAVKKPAVRAPKPRAQEEIPQTIMGNNAEVAAPRKPGRKPVGDGPAETIAITLPSELKRQLQDEAARQDRSAAAVVRQALRLYFSDTDRA